MTIGRVIALSPEQAVIATSSGTLRVPTDQVSCQLGDWVQLETASGGGHRLVQVNGPHAEPRGDGEVARFVLAGGGERLRKRQEIVRSVREFFERRQYLEVQTPTLVRAPGLDAHVQALRVDQGNGESGYLITSPEFHMKRLVVGGLPKIYQIATCFRAEEIGAWHEPQFTMLEWYEAFLSYEELIAQTEALVSELAHTHAGGRLQKNDGERVREVNAEVPFPRVTVKDAFQSFAHEPDAADLAATRPDRYFEIMVSSVEPALARFDTPVFLVNYPLSEAALARPCPAAPGYAERFELYAGGVELCNGYGELTDGAEQRRRFLVELERREAAGEAQYPLDERFLSALGEGMPPTSGNALGLDRVVALLVGAPGIAGVQAFPASHA